MPTSQAVFVCCDLEVDGGEALGHLGELGEHVAPMLPKELEALWLGRRAQPRELGIAVERSLVRKPIQRTSASV